MRRDKLYLADIVEACDDIAEFIQGHDQDSFATDKVLRGAVLHVKFRVTG